MALMPLSLSCVIPSWTVHAANGDLSMDGLDSPFCLIMRGRRSRSDRSRRHTAASTSRGNTPCLGPNCTYTGIAYAGSTILDFGKRHSLEVGHCQEIGRAHV